MAIVLRSEYKLEASRGRDSAGLKADLTDYREFVFRCALAICGEREGAEDVAQEVLLTLFRVREKLANVDNPTAWVRKVTVRCATRHLKRNKPSGRLPDSFQSAETSADKIAVYEILCRLSPEQRAILGMSLSQGLSYREIGEALDIPEGTVASRLNAAKKEFQRRWEQ